MIDILQLRDMSSFIITVRISRMFKDPTITSGSKYPSMKISAAKKEISETTDNNTETKNPAQYLPQ